MARRHVRYSLFCFNNIILPKRGIGGSLQFLQGSPGTPVSTGGVPLTFYRGPRGPPFPMEGFPHVLQGSLGTPASNGGVPSMFYRGPWGPPFPMEGFPPCFTGVRGNPCSNGEVPRMFYKGFPQFCRGLLLRCLSCHMPQASSRVRKLDQCLCQDCALPTRNARAKQMDRAKPQQLSRASATPIS
jgi:hypothetical protein